MNRNELRTKYNMLFPDDRIKAEAFDKIAENYYFCNFGEMSKSDFEVLLFSLYIDRILENSADDMQTYGDYFLSKYLGITQSRIRSLKEKKELKYPNSKFDWKSLFCNITKNARYENGKIKINIQDKNLYIEINNVITNAGGYIEQSLSPTLLTISPEYFINLILDISDETDRAKIISDIKEQLKKNNMDISKIENKTIGEYLAENKAEISTSLISELMNLIPVVGPSLSSLIKSAVQNTIH